MPLYVDIHRIHGAVTMEEIATAHAADVAIQEQYGVSYIKYWFDASRGKIFCMCTAPDAETAERVHREAHGMMAERIIAVDEDLAESMLGGPVAGPNGCVMHGGRPDPGARTIMFTDIVGSTAMTQQLGDRAAMALVEAHDEIVRAALQAHHGREVKHLGDGIMAAFHTAGDACACARRIHRDLVARDKIAAAPLRVKIGAASGDPVERDGDFFGSTVQLASRLCAHAQAGQTVVSSQVIELASNDRFADLGDVQLKGFAGPVHAHRLVED
ncbi:MAG TPA: nickel-binding protein [Kofleriaceae bacterium]|jgi:class 3 adenylate cyclase|nr:nickel-binding protein [Kofleriaceae bacterium]